MKVNLTFNPISCLYFIRRLKLAKLSATAKENDALRASLTAKVNAVTDKVMQQILVKLLFSTFSLKECSLTLFSGVCTEFEYSPRTPYRVTEFTLYETTLSTPLPI